MSGILDKKYHFTSDDSDRRKIIKKETKYHDEDCLKIVFALYSSNGNSTFWKKYQFPLKNVSYFRKQLIEKVEHFLKSNFDLNLG